MKYVIAIAALMLLATSASAQGYFGGSDGGMGRSHGYTPQPGYRAINHDPATGRTYARDADYIPVRKARPKVRR
jgi:ABC-type cobalt transport system substrate-binding protein